MQHDRVAERALTAGDPRYVGEGAQVDGPRGGGVAGRDGEPATAWLAYGLQDVVQQRKLIEGSEGDEQHRRSLAMHLDAMLALCETADCRRVRLLAYFGQAGEPCGNCDTCLTPVESWDGTVAAQKLLSTVWRLARERRQKFGAGQPAPEWDVGLPATEGGGERWFTSRGRMLLDAHDRPSKLVGVSEPSLMSSPASAWLMMVGITARADCRGP